MKNAVKRVASLLAFLFVICGMTPAYTELAVTENAIVLRDSGELYYLIDPYNTLTLAQAQQSPDWQRVIRSTQLPRRDPSTLWLRARIAAAATDQYLLLFHAVPRRIELALYMDGASDKDRAGDMNSANDSPRAAIEATQPLPYARYLFPVHVAAGESADIYLRARGNLSEAMNDLQLWPHEKLMLALPKFSAVEWANISILSLVIVTSSVMWLFVRQSLFGLFALLIAAQLATYIAAQGYTVNWPWLNSPALSAFAHQLTIPVSTIIGIIFATAFLDLRHHARRLDYLTKSLIAVFALLGALMPLMPRWSEAISIAMIPLNWIVLIGISAYLYRRGINRGHAGVLLVCWLIWVGVIFAFVTAAYFDTDRAALRYLTDVSVQLRTVLFIVCLGYHYRQTVRSEEHARADARTKSEFLARMSHEIRTPMNGILGMAELLRDSGLSNTQRRYNDIVYSSATALLTVINDILDFSKIQAGRMAVETIPFDLHCVAVDTLTLFRLKADEKNLELLCDIRPDVPAWVLGDPTRLRQILINFLSNAIKFTEAGEIRLHVFRNGDGVRLAVEDTGFGIAPELQPRLFESFTQGDVSIARRHGGTGLGLSITAQLAELMGGSVGMQSRPDEGSTFWVELPLPPTAKQEPVPVEANLAGKSILVVDDNLHFCELIAEHIKNWGMQLQIAHSGAEALALVAAARAQQRTFDLISIDLKMPGMNGVDLAHALKAACGPALPPLLLLTATIDIPHSAIRRAAGIVLAEEKPLLARDLRAAFARALGLAIAPAANQAQIASAEQSAQALTVLVVEDNPTNQIVVQSMLHRLGHDCVLAASGEEAVALCTARHHEFDVVLMDCEMPGMSGYEATQRIRAREQERQLARLKIVALTAHTLDEHIELCRSSGMDGHLAKPLSILQLREFLATLAGAEISQAPVSQ